MATSKYTRIHKGDNLLDFPKDYVVVDIETTGRDPRYCDIIEVAAIRYRDDKEVASFDSLVRPHMAEKDKYDEQGNVCIVDDFIERLTGISNNMLASARSVDEVIPEFHMFIGEDIIIGHNVHFDINFLYDAFEKWDNFYLSNNFVDTLRLSRRILKDGLSNHKLMCVAKHYNVNYEGAHRALIDCKITGQCYFHLKEDAIKKYGSVQDFQDAARYRCSSRNRKKDVPVGDCLKHDPDNPFFEKNVVITGELELYTRKDAEQIIADIGGINQKNVTKKTNYLILGNNDFNRMVKDGKSNKQKKAEAYILAGQDLQIISENVFYEMINRDKESQND